MSVPKGQEPRVIPLDRPLDRPESVSFDRPNVEQDAERRQSELVQKTEAIARELSQKREAVKEAQRPEARHSPVRTRRADSKPELAPKPRPPARNLGPSMVDDVASEFEALLRDVRDAWRGFQPADRISLLAALVTLWGTLLPWVARSPKFSLSGLEVGGVLHAGLAAICLWQLVHRSRSRLELRGQRLSTRELHRASRRMSLWHLLMGAASTLLSLYFLLSFGLERFDNPALQVRYGLYVTLAAGMGLSYGGFRRFWSRDE